MAKRVPILSYHAIIGDEQDELPQDWSRYHAVQLSALRRQFDLLTAESWQVVLPETLRQRSLPAKCTIITFDDGYASDLLAARELSRRGQPAVFFVTWSRLGRPGFLDHRSVVDLDRDGFRIGSHCITHTRLTSLTSEDLRYQLAGSKEYLECLLGKPVTDLAIPFGAYNRQVVTAAFGAGYRTIMTSDFGLAVPGSELLARLTVHSHITLQDFRALLGGSSFWIARQRVLNALYRGLGKRPIFNRLLGK